MMAASASSPRSGNAAEVPADLCVSAGRARLPVTVLSSQVVAALPLLDPAVLEDLTEDLGVLGTARQFVLDYAAL